MAKKRNIVLIHKRAPGDIVTMTGLVRDIAKTVGDRVSIGVQTTAPDIWKNNPYITEFPAKSKGNKRSDVEYINAQYGRGIKDQNYRPVHFLGYWHEDFERQTGIKVPLTLPYPDLHLSEEEHTVPLIEGRYWVTLSGGKSDYPVKVWHVKKLQEVVDGLGGMGLGVVQIGSNDSGHWHPLLHGDHVIDLRGKTNLRDMMRLIYHADGVICGITCAMHMAAALQRPCVVLGGGREAWWWEGYVRENKGLAPVQELLEVPHRYLHTIGLLDCCRQHGCWKNKVVSISKDQSLCYNPVLHPEQPIPLCMDMIKPEHVLEAVMKYYEDKTLPPIGGLPATPPVTEGPQALPPKKEPERNLLNLFDDPPEETDEPVAENPPASTPCKTEPHKVRTTASVKLPPGVTPEEFFKNARVRVNPTAKMEGRGKLSERPISEKPGMPNAAVVSQNTDVFDHKDVGGKVTIFVLFYGGEEYFDLHRRCLTSIITTVPFERMDLRVGSNALNNRSVEMIENFVKQGVITKHYRHRSNDMKYPVMREMFHDPEHPITTKWVLWFDDDSIADQTPAWLNLLAQHIIQYHRRDNAHMFGAPFVWTLKPGQRQWYEGRAWHKGKPWRAHNGKPSPNGNKILFCTGGFWAITYEAIVKANIPDAELGHNGGDVTIGEQLYQAGFGMKTWNAKKQFVHTSSVGPRGISQKPDKNKLMPGQAGYQMPKLIQVE